MIEFKKITQRKRKLTGNTFVKVHKVEKLRCRVEQTKCKS